MAAQLILQDLEDLCVLLVRVVTESYSPICAMFALGLQLALLHRRS